MKSIKAIFWDLDGTLIDSEYLHEEAAFNVTQKFGIDPKLDVVTTGLENRAVFNILFANSKQDKDKLFIEWEQQVVDYVLQRVDIHKQINQSIVLFKQFTKLGIRQCVVSNSKYRLIKHTLEQLGLIKDCHKIFSRDDVEFGKPHPEIYLQALQYHDISKDNCLVFEDSYSGIQAAKAAGLEVVGVGETTIKYSPAHVCYLHELDWFHKLNSVYYFGSG